MVAVRVRSDEKSVSVRSDRLLYRNSKEGVPTVPALWSPFPSVDCSITVSNPHARKILVRFPLALAANENLLGLFGQKATTGSGPAARSCGCWHMWRLIIRASAVNTKSSKRSAQLGRVEGHTAATCCLRSANDSSHCIP
jgi:hypothetical protein